MSYNTKIYKDQGGSREIVLPGAVLRWGNVTFSIAADGNVIVTGLPTTEPVAVGALYSNNGVLTISNGP